MLDEVVKTIGWKNMDDKETVILREDILRALPRLKGMEKDLRKIKGSAGVFVRSRGLNSTHDVLVVLRRLCRANGHAITYRRASRNNGNTPVYLYSLI
jgi:hypothetical protein